LDEKGLIFQLPPEPLPSNQVSYWLGYLKTYFVKRCTLV
jgi:hypothetical protein